MAEQQFKGALVPPDLIAQLIKLGQQAKLGSDPPLDDDKNEEALTKAILAEGTVNAKPTSSTQKDETEV